MGPFSIFIIVTGIIYLGSEVYSNEILLGIGIRDSLEPGNAYIHLKTEWGNGRYHWGGTPYYSDLVTQSELMFKIFKGELPQRFTEILFIFPVSEFSEVNVKLLEVFDFPQQENYLGVTGYLMAMEHYMAMCSAFPNNSTSDIEEVLKIYSLIRSGVSPLDREQIVIDLLRNEKKSFIFVEKILGYSPKKFVAGLEAGVNFNYENLKNVPEFEKYFTGEKAPEYKLKELIDLYNSVKTRREL